MRTLDPSSDLCPGNKGLAPPGRWQRVDRKGRCSGPLAKGSRGLCGGLHDASTHLHHHGKEVWPDRSGL